MLQFLLRESVVTVNKIHSSISKYANIVGVGVLISSIDAQALKTEHFCWNLLHWSIPVLQSCIFYRLMYWSSRFSCFKTNSDAKVDLTAIWSSRRKFPFCLGFILMVPFITFIEKAFYTSLSYGLLKCYCHINKMIWHQMHGVSNPVLKNKVQCHVVALAWCEVLMVNWIV